MAATIYTNCLTLTLGCFLYQDAGLTTPVSNGEYSDGTDVFTVTGGAGEITASALCNPPTSTTTSTTTAPITTSTTTSTSTNLSCQDSVTFDVDIAGSVSYLDCCGNQVVTFYGIGPQVIIDCITSNTLAGYYNPPTDFPATISNVGYSGVSCVCATTTTTSTTTAAPLTANIQIINGSLDIEISQVDFNGVTATFVGGQPLPNTTGNGTDLNTNQIGTYTLDVFKNNSVSGQHITVTDSNGTPQCIFFGSGAATLSYSGVVYDGITNIQIDAQDGAC